MEIKEVKTETNVDMERTKDVIRHVYQEMSSFVDVISEISCHYRLENDEEKFDRYEDAFLNVENALHSSMLDLPPTIYHQLNNIVENEFKVHVYGTEVDGSIAKVWDTPEYMEYLKKKKYTKGEYAESRFVEEYAERFYKSIREILKEYILV